ncbi:MAG: hypothetical protein ACI89L_000592 [Phycisphaerales bacterium]|jgi:hypothetical protein
MLLYLETPMPHAKAAFLSLAAFVGTASAQHSTFMYTDQPTDTVSVVDPSGVASPLLTITPGSIRLAMPVEINGLYYCSHGRGAGNPTGGIFRLDDLFGATPIFTDIVSDNMVQHPVDMIYHAPTGELVTVNNPGANEALDPRIEGVIATLPDGTSRIVYQEPNAPRSDPYPRFSAGFALTADPLSDDVFVVSINGGVGTGAYASDNEGSTIWRVDVSTGAISLFADLSGTTLGTLTFIRGIAALDNGDLAVCDRRENAIYRLHRDGAGDFNSISLIYGNVDGPRYLQYDAALDNLVLYEQDLDVISQVKPNGTGYQVLLAGADTRGILVLPPPPPACPADTNGDGILDNGDIGTFVTLFLAGDLAADFNGDGILDNGDIGGFVAAFLAGCA